MNDSAYIAMMNKPRVPGIEIVSKHGTVTCAKNIEEATAFLAYYIGLKSAWDGFNGLQCGMSIEKTGCYITFQVTPNFNGSLSSARIDILQKLIPVEYAGFSAKDKFIYSDYEDRLRSMVECLKGLCCDNRIKHNLYHIKDCKTCKKLMFIDKEDCVCRFCNPELYRDKPKEQEKNYGYIYFCTDDQYIKIGSSSKYPDKRILSLSTRYHKKFTLIGYIYTDNFVKKEHEIHRFLAPQRIAGEWFNIPLSNLEKMLFEHGYNCIMMKGIEALITS